MALFLVLGGVFERTVKAAAFLLGPQAFLKLDKIIGRTPAQVWTAFNDEVDRQVYGLIERQAARYGTQECEKTERATATETPAALSALSKGPSRRYFELQI